MNEHHASGSQLMAQIPLLPIEAAALQAGRPIHYHEIAPPCRAAAHALRFHFGPVPAYLCADMYGELDIGGVGCYRLNEARVTTDAVIMQHGDVLCSRALNHPDEHVRRMLANDRTAWPVRRVAGRAALLHGPGYDVYGHWLVDFLPRLYVLNQAGYDIESLRFVLPTRTPPVALEFLRLVGIPCENLFAYDEKSELVQADELLVPTILRLKSRLSPLFAAATHFWAERFCARAGITAPTCADRKIFVSRSHASSNRRVKNRLEIEAKAVQAGYEVVHPQGLPLAGQFALFRSAGSIVGEYGSGLHNSIFAPPGAIICALRGTSHAPGFVQSSLAGAFDHEIGYGFGASDEHADAQDISINVDHFARALDIMALWRAQSC